MRIIGKSIIKESDLKGKANICKNIEVQLFKEFDDGLKVDFLYNEIIKIEDVKVLVVHSPIIDGEDVNFEFMTNYKDSNRIMNSIILAGKLSKYYNEKVKVVIHSAFRYENYDKMPGLIDRVVEFFQEIFYRYPLVDFCIENVVPIKITRNGNFYLRNNCLYDGVDLVKRLNFYFSTNRFGTVLDTCHALITIRGLKNYFSDYPEISKKFSLEEYFEVNKDYIKLIHLANVINLGYDKGTHGILFRDEDMPLMNEIMNYYKKYNYNCDITIEILEDDYVKNDNFRDNYYKLLKLCKDRNILIE